MHSSWMRTARPLVYRTGTETPPLDRDPLDRDPTVNRITDRCKNITFDTPLRTVIREYNADKNAFLSPSQLALVQLILFLF